MAPPSRLLAAAALAASATAHFTLNYPITSGFDDDKEDEGPCGSFTPDFTKITDFHVGGDAIALTLLHPQANWLFRYTLDKTGESNWTEAFPIVQQSGQGNFCEPSISVPADLAGQQGVLGVVCDSPDGILYQCAAVNFVAGTGTAPANCTNGTVTATFTTDSSLAVGAGTGSSNSSGSTTSGTSSPSASKSGNAAPGLLGATNWGLLATGIVMPLVMASIGAALMI